MDQNFDLRRLMTEPITLKHWISCGLPDEKLAIENAVFVFNGGRWPLMIDPQTQANR